MRWVVVVVVVCGERLLDVYRSFNSPTRTVTCDATRRTPLDKYAVFSLPRRDGHQHAYTSVLIMKLDGDYYKDDDYWQKARPRGSCER